MSGGVGFPIGRGIPDGRRRPQVEGTSVAVRAKGNHVMRRSRGHPNVGLLVVSVLLISACVGSSSHTATGHADPEPVSYLEAAIPPCTRLEKMQKDPCEFDTVPHVEMLSVAHGLLEIEGLLPNFTDLLNGTNLPGLFVPHIAIRGTVQPNTTRCELYSAILGNFASPVPGLEQDGFYYCFVDATVNE